MKRIAGFFALLLPVLWLGPNALAADNSFDGLNLNLGNVSRTSKAKTRSISPENFSGEKGKAGMSTDGPAKSAARDLGQGWKVSPSIGIPAHATVTLAEMAGPGNIQQIWMTPTGDWRLEILRFYWDGETDPSVEVPVADFFASGWATRGNCPLFSSIPVCVYLVKPALDISSRYGPSGKLLST